jgi:hypothetical protein
MQYLRAFEDPEIGDKYEGKGEVILSSKPIHSATINNVYVLSCSLPAANQTVQALLFLLNLNLREASNKP